MRNLGPSKFRRLVIVCVAFSLFWFMQMSLVVNLATQDAPHYLFASTSIREIGPHNRRKAKSRQLPASLTASCVTIQCIQQEAASLARAFPDRSNRTWQVKEMEDHSTMHYGLLYSRIPKTGSSTITAAALRISHKYSVWLKGISHAVPSEEEFGKRHPTKSFMFASVRDPAKRATSYISYDRSRESRNLSEAELFRSLQTFDTYGGVIQSEGRGGSQLAYASLKFIPKLSAWRRSFPTQVLNPQRVKENVQHILQNYDFLLVTERMDESLVAMAMTMGVSLEDVLVFNSKVGDSHFLPVHHKDGTVTCIPLSRNQHSNSTSIQAYFNSDEWHAMNYGDYLLHSAASVSLDSTIRAIGEERFQQAMTKYKTLMALATKKCVPQRIHRPCSSTGKLQIEKASKDCYHSDAGCGYPCIDEMLSDMSHAHRY